VSPDNSYYAPTLDVPVNTTVGAGDSMVAGMVASFNMYENAELALRWGIACGAGTVMHPGTELFNSGEISELQSKVQVKQLNI
jgi:6-phosphofructokinase 2